MYGQQPPGGPPGGPPPAGWGLQAGFGAPPASAPVQPMAAPAYGQAPPVYGAPPPAAYSGPPAYGGPPQPQYSAPPPMSAPADPAARQHQQASLPPAMPPPGGAVSRKKALLIGCSYPGTRAQLNGCLNDVECIRYLLKSKFGFQDDGIVVLKDDRSTDPRGPFFSTRANILKGIQWLLTDMQPGTSLFFHFSGHGSQKRSIYGDEEDGMDETLLPTDYERAGQITDNELNKHMVEPLIPGVTLHAVIDACHSGTVLDLPYSTFFNGREFLWKTASTQRGFKQTRGGTAFQFGACKDHQVAADTNALSGSAYTGAATFSFIQAIETYGTKQPYGQLLAHMHSLLDKGASQAGPALPVGGGGGGLLGMVLGSVLGGGGGGGHSLRKGQSPVLSCNQPVRLDQMLML